MQTRTVVLWIAFFLWTYFCKCVYIFAKNVFRVFDVCHFVTLFQTFLSCNCFLSCREVHCWGCVHVGVGACVL